MDGGLTALPLPTGFVGCVGRGINSGGAAVGWCIRPGPNPDDSRQTVTHATLWPDAGHAVDLNEVANTGAWVLEIATGIGADGHIIGGVVRNGERRGFLLTPLVNIGSECGGRVPCRCGDRVAADYTFTAHLGPCTQGLTVASGVKVTGQGFGLFGIGEGIGLLFDGSWSHVIGLHVTGFGDGVIMRNGGQGNLYQSAWVWNHRRHGVWLDQAGPGTWVWEVYSLLNGLSGIKLDGTQGTNIAYSFAWSNPVSLWLDHADRNTVWLGGWYGDRGPAAALVDSHQNALFGNSIYCAGGGPSFSTTARTP